LEADISGLKLNTFRTGSKIRLGTIEVEPIHVDHSVPAAYGFLVYTSEGTLVYTGDLRAHGTKSEMTKDFVERAREGKADALLAEGTNLIGATLTTDKIYQAFYADYKEKKTFFHGHTFTANPLACVAALASLEIFEEENVLEKVGKILPFFHKTMEEFKDLPLVGDVRYLGLIAALELVKDKKTKQGFSFEERIGFEIFRKGLKRNLLLRPLGNIAYLFLPLSIKRNEIEDILDRTYAVIKSLN